MNIICEHKYNQIKHILSGCRSSLDAYQMADIYCKKHPEMKNIMNSMINGKRFENVFDFKTIKNNIQEINNCIYGEEANDIFEKISKQTTDQLYIKTFKRIVNNKMPKPLTNIQITSYPHKKTKCTKYIKFKSLDYPPCSNMIEKQCPHCKHICSAIATATHIVCGYSDSHTGYDWEGCSKDWCFQCGKILCKSWDIHQLFQKENCIHDNLCCKKHAKEHKKNYPNDYCQCTNEFVRRI